MSQQPLATWIHWAFGNQCPLAFCYRSLQSHNCYLQTSMPVSLASWQRRLHVAEVSLPTCTPSPSHLYSYCASHLRTSMHQSLHTPSHTPRQSLGLTSQSTPFFLCTLAHPLWTCRIKKHKWFPYFICRFIITCQVSWAKKGYLIKKSSIELQD